MKARDALVGAVLALPIALLMSAAARWSALAAALPALVGLLVLDHALRRRVADGTAFWTLVLAAYGTTLFPLLAHAPDARRATAFLLGALALLARGRASTVLFLAAVVAGLALGGGWALDGPGIERSWFGSREGLLFRTPLLWGSLCGLVVLARRHGKAAAPLVIVGLLPFLLAPFARSGALDVALPALMLALAIALDAACRLLARRPAWALAAALPPIAISNLLFMEQYRDTLRRDDTVSFPQVSEGNARLLAAGMGSPNAWPANWIWSARHGLPVERWDLLSGQRLDPGTGVVIDVGDLDQDAAFLLDGWSVRHACGDSICREVEGRAEIVLPLERPAEGLTLRAQGPGALRVTVNGFDAGPVALGPELTATRVPGPGLRRGLNRVVLDPAPGTHALIDGLSLQEPGR
jgi:hypothetical protein